MLEDVPDVPRLFRIDSAGESFEVERQLLRWGASAARGLPCRRLSPAQVAALRDDRGRIIAPRQAHLGFLGALKQIGAVLRRRKQWVVLNPLADIVELFDKRITHRRWSRLGIPVPEALTRIRTVKQLDAAMARRHWQQVFVKVSSSSSASCLAVYRPGPTPVLHTTIEVADTGWYNTLRVRTVHGRRQVDELLNFLLREGSQIERAVPKAKHDGAFFDLRVLCIEGEPRFWVVRQNRHPITNLHLGGWRGDLESLRHAVPTDAWREAMDSCRRVARLYSALHVGIDLMFEPGFTAHRVIEANAFGDLLPNLLNDGLSVYGYEIRAAARRASGPSGARSRMPSPNTRSRPSGSK